MFALKANFQLSHSIIAVGADAFANEHRLDACWNRVGE